jgi:transposase
LNLTTQFFLNPQQPTHRRYEILRALFIDRLPAKEVAKIFGCSVFTVNAIKRDFKEDIRSGKPPTFFVSPRPGRKPKDNRDQLREHILSLRKQNYSILDIQAALDAMGHQASHDFIHRILVEDGFARLPRRSTLEKRRGAMSRIVAPQSRNLDWEEDLGREFHSERGIGLFAFLPLLVKLNVHRWIEDAGYPETSELGRVQSVLSFLALKLSGYERYSQDDLWAMDRSLGLFAGLNVLPKAATLSSYSYRVDREMNRRFLRAMQKTFKKEGLFSGLVNLDFTAIPHWGDESVLENNWSGKRRQALKSVLAVLCQDPDTGIFCYSDAEVMHRNQPECVLEFVDFWQQGGGSPKCLIFDSKFTTYENLGRLDQKGIKFITLRRRGKKLIEQIEALPPERWQTVRVSETSRKHQKVNVHESTVRLTKEGPPFRQLVLTGHGRKRPAFILTNERRWDPAHIVEQYAKRWLVEKGISEQIHFFHLNRASSSIVVKVDFDLTLTAAAHNLYRTMAIMLKGYEWQTSKSLHTKFLANGGSFKVMQDRVTISMKKKRHLPLILQMLKELGPTKIPWLGNRLLDFEAWSAS